MGIGFSITADDRAYGAHDSYKLLKSIREKLETIGQKVTDSSSEVESEVHSLILEIKQDLTTVKNLIKFMSC